MDGSSPKTDSITGQPLPGASFRVTGPNGYDKTFVTDILGKIELSKLPLGKYNFKEIEAPDGYQLPTNRTITFDATKFHTVGKSVQNSRSTGKITIIKKDKDNGNAISGATFQLKDSDGKIIVSGTTNSSGQCSLNGVPWGIDYFLEEITAPTGYKTLSDPIQVRLEKDELVTGKILEIENERIPGSIQIVKTDTDTGETLADAHFKLVNSSTKQTIIDDIVTNAFGIASVTDLDWGSYNLVETQAPLGHMLSSQVTSFSINASNAEETQQIGITNDSSIGTLTIAKVDGSYIYAQGDEDKSWYYNGGKLLADAQFDLIDQDGNTYCSFSTVDNKPVSIENIPYGSYTLKENKAPYGYQAGNDISITFDRAHREFTVENQPGSAVLTASKNIPGAEFALYRYTDLGWWNSIRDFRDSYAKIDPIHYNNYDWVKVKNLYPQIINSSVPFFSSTTDYNATTASYQGRSVEWIGTRYATSWKIWDVIDIYSEGLLNGDTWTGNVQLSSGTYAVTLTNIPSFVTPANPYVLYGRMDSSYSYSGPNTTLDNLFDTQFEEKSLLYSYGISETQNNKIHLYGFTDMLPLISSSAVNSKNTYDIVEPGTGTPTELKYGTYLLVENSAGKLVGTSSNWDGTHGIQGPFAESYEQYFNAALMKPGYNNTSANINDGIGMPDMLVPIIVQPDTVYNGEINIGTLENNLRYFTFRVNKYKNAPSSSGSYNYVLTKIPSASGLWSVNSGMPAFDTCIRNTDETVTLPLTREVLHHLDTLVAEEIPPDGLSITTAVHSTGFTLTIMKGNTDLAQNGPAYPEYVNGNPYYVFNAIAVRTTTASGKYQYKKLVTSTSNISVPASNFSESGNTSYSEFLEYLVDTYLTNNTYDFGTLDFVNDVSYSPNIYIYKHDDTVQQSPVANAELTLFYQKDANTEPIAVETVTTTSRGTANFDLRYQIINGQYVQDLYQGMLWIEETKVPDGYKKIEGQEGIAFDLSRGNNTFECRASAYPQYELPSSSCSYEIVNHNTRFLLPHENMSVKLTKHNKDTDKPVYGAAFELYVRGEDTPFYQIGEIQKTNANGMIVWELQEDIQIGDILRIVEQPRPDIAENKLIWDHQVTEEDIDNGEVIFSDDESRVIYNTLKQGKLLINKIDKESKANITEAVFDIYDAETKKLAAADISVDDKGQADVDLPLGKYFIIEKTVPTGYHLDPSSLVPVVGIPNAAWATEVEISSYEVDTEVNIPNVKNISTLSIHKIDSQTGQSLQDAVFELQDINGNVLYSNLSTLENGRTLPIEIESGEYILREVKAPNRYVLNNTPVNIKINTNVDMEIAIPNVPQAELSVLKVSNDTSTPLQGAEFDVLNESESFIGHLITEDNGISNIITLDPGRYLLRETKAPEGYQKIESDIKISLSNNTCFTIENKPVPKTVTIVKQDAKTKNGIAGVEMSLKHQTLVEQPSKLLSTSFVSKTGSWSGSIDSNFSGTASKTSTTGSLKINVNIQGGIILNIPVTIGDHASLSCTGKGNDGNKKSVSGSVSNGNLRVTLPGTCTSYTLEIIGRYSWDSASSKMTVRTGSITATSTETIMATDYVPIANFTTDENGEYRISNLQEYVSSIPEITDDDVLYLFEDTPAPGYIPTDECLGEIDLTENAPKEQVITAENTKIKTSIRIWKICKDNNQVIPGTQFQIQQEDGTYILNPDTNTNIFTTSYYNSQVNGTSLPRGAINIGNLEWGEKYYIYETYVPSGYELDPTPTIVELTPDDIDTMKEIYIYNHVEGYYYTPIFKKELHGRALEGGEFTFEISNTPDGSAIWTATNDADGNIVFPEIYQSTSISPNTSEAYYVREVNTGDPSIIYDSTIKELELTYTVDGRQHIVTASTPSGDTFYNEACNSPITLPFSGENGIIPIILTGIGILLISFGLTMREKTLFK